jgi:hypothetical protein
MAEHPGSTGTVIARFLGNATDLLVLRAWQDRRAFDDFMAGPGGQYPRSRPAGIYAGLAVGQNWDQQAFSTGPATGSLIFRVGYAVNNENWEEFWKLCEQTQQLCGWLGSLVEMRACRGLDNETEALVLVRLRDRDALEELVQSPSKVAIDSEMKDVASELFNECFEVVYDTPSKSPT